MTLPALALTVLALTPTAVREAERVAEQAAASAAVDLAPALAQARRALAMTAEFDPTAFVEPGRKGELVEDEFRLARRRYRHHRAILYAAMGECLAAGGDHLPASRYFRRAALLEPRSTRVVRLARSLLDLGRPAEALRVLREGADGQRPTPELAAVVEAAADQLGLPSAQAELDRIRLRAFPQDQLEVRAGLPAIAPRARLSTGAPFQLQERPLVLYVAAPDCRTCSEDVQTLARALPEGVRPVAVPADPEQDQALRQVLRLYRQDWPVLLGYGDAAAAGLSPGTVVVLARNGWLLVTVKRPMTLVPAVVEALTLNTVTESLPRKEWNGRPPAPLPEPEAPKLLPEGLAPGEYPPPPSPFTAAAEAFRAGRFPEALRLFEAAEKKNDGYLLPPEARFNRALCLARLGRNDEARRMLLAIGDSRFQEEVDRVLEGLGARS